MSLGRYQLLERPIVPPGVCFSCGSATKPVLDMVKDINGWGAVYLCLDCARELGHAAGLLDPSNVLDERTITENFMRKVGLSILTEDLANALRNLVVLAGALDSLDPLHNSRVEDAGPEPQSTSTTNSEPEPTDTARVEPPVVENSDGIPDFTSGDFDFSFDSK